MNPVTAFRALRDVASRRPLVVGVAGLGLLGEAARVGAAVVAGRAVTLFGHGGGEVWNTAADAPWVAAYVGWVGLCGLAGIGIAVAGWRAKRRAAGGPVAPAPVIAPSPRRASLAAGPGVVVRRRAAETKRPNRRG